MTLLRNKTTQKVKQKPQYELLPLIGKNIAFCLLFFLLSKILDYYLVDKTVSIIVSDEQDVFLALLYSLIVSLLCAYILYKNADTDLVAKYLGLFFLLFTFMFSYNILIYYQLSEYFNNLGSSLYKSEYAIITGKESKISQHNGGRSGAYSHTTYAIDYHTTTGRASNIVYDGHHWEHFNEGDSIVFKYYKGRWFDYHRVEKIK